MTRSLHEQVARKCVHYATIFDHKQCAVGVVYKSIERVVRDGAPGCVPLRLPCFKDPGAAECALAKFLTPEEVNTRVEEIVKASDEFIAKLGANICGHCSTPMTGKRRSGHCLYAVPCGHRLGQA